jgi:hypothetical protein
MNTKKQVKVLVTLATLMSTTAISSAVYAGDAKVYAGSECYLARQTSSNIGSLDLFGGQSLNVGTSPIEVMCPIVRDITTGTENGSTGPKATVHVFSNNAARTTIECDLRAFGVNKLGPTTGQFQRLTTTLSGGILGTPAKFALNFTGPIQQTPNGAYNIRCTLPAGTGVGTYIVFE